MTVISPALGAPATTSHPTVGLGCWTILDESSDEVRATVTREREMFTVRNHRGKVLGKYPTAILALASVG